MNTETGKIVVWTDGSWKYFSEGITWEYENDPDWLATIALKEVRDVN